MDGRGSEARGLQGRRRRRSLPAVPLCTGRSVR